MLLSEFIDLKEKPGCNLTEEGRACAVHGLNECPGYKMIETSTSDKLYRRHQELRKKSGLPNPDYYKELKATFDLPDEERHVAVAALKKKYNVNESLRPGEYHHYETDPETGKRVYKGIRGERYGSPGGDRRGDDQERRDREARAHRHHDRKMTEREVDEDSIDDSLGAQYSTPQAKAKTQAIDRAFTSGQQTDFDRLGIISPQQIERDYKTMRAGEKAQDAAVYANPALTPGARSAPTFKTNPKGVPIRERQVDEAGPFSYGAKKPRKGSVADLAAQKRKEQEKDRQPVEPKDHMVGVARVVKEGEDLSQYSTERLKAYVKKVSGGGVPAFGSGAKLKRVQAELKRRESGVAEGYIPIVVPKPIKEPKTKPIELDIRMHPAKEQGMRDAMQGKPYKNPYKFDKNKSAPENADYRLYKSGYKSAKQGVAESVEQYLEELSRAGYEVITETAELCPECGGPAFADRLLAEKQDACYHKVKSRYKVWPSAYASGALVRCRKKGAKNWGNKSKK